ncbi:MAG: insulinase family protein [Pseudomonadales bacterium]|nr:insulinase family protein [Pseudomonadales bacterium]
MTIAHHTAFDLIRTQSISALNVEVQEYRHLTTGAQHIHVAADNNENVFLVALRTVPTDSKGVAHILEHTALCGSERYPVRDPFFMMIRRSLNTFMNAFTSSDWTAYPFASQNKKDFNNLLGVYLDAVFFSRLDPLDFAQEGHRMEFAEAKDSTSDLVFKGVVFNEMKGAMSSAASTLYDVLYKYVYPTSTYHYNSGGDPEHITDLSYEELKGFYKNHYHPSNAVFMTYGDIPVIEHQTQFEELALKRFEQSPETISVDDEKRYYAPITVEECYPIPASESVENKTHTVLAWLLNRADDLDTRLQAHLLSNVLLENSASPLRKVLETTKLGSAPSPLCGLDDSQLEMCFMCGIEGSNPEDADAVEQLVIDTLQDVAANGVPLEEVEAVLHQLELSQREVGGDGYPYGLQIILSGLSAAMHRGDTIAAMDLETALDRLRVSIKDPQFIPNLAKQLLLENPHRVRLSLKPDPLISERKEQAEKDLLARIKSKLSTSEKQDIIDQTQALENRQAQEDDASVLPKVGLQDVPAGINIPESIESSGQCKSSYYAQGTNGLVYQQVIYDLPQLDNTLLQSLPLFTSCLTELGCADKDYLAVQSWQSRISGGVSAFTTLRGSTSDVQSVAGHFTLSSKALANNHLPLCELIQATLEDPRFDELQRIREIVAQDRAQLEQSVTGQGHSLAMNAATSGMSPASALSHRLSGLKGIQSLKKLDDSLNQQENLEALANQFQTIHSLIKTSPKQFLLVGEKEKQEQLHQDLQATWCNNGGHNIAHNNKDTSKHFQAITLPAVQEQVKEAWIANSQVNFCAKAYPTVPPNHPDAPVLNVLGAYLRNGFLHRVIREQGGAYGGGAAHNANIAAFQFFSYRDPRLAETLSDFDKSIEWLMDGKKESRFLEEAILGIVGDIDKPSSPAGEAKQAFHSKLYGRTSEYRNQYRQQVLQVSVDDLRRVAESYLQPEKASTAVVTHQAQWDQTPLLDFTVEKL